MNIELTIQLGTLISVVVGFAALLQAMYRHHRDANAQVFLKYTERYDQVMRALEEAVPREGFSETGFSTPSLDD